MTWYFILFKWPQQDVIVLQNRRIDKRLVVIALCVITVVLSLWVLLPAMATALVLCGFICGIHAMMRETKYRKLHHDGVDDDDHQLP